MLTKVKNYLRVLVIFCVAVRRSWAGHGRCVFNCCSRLMVSEVRRRRESGASDVSVCLTRNNRREGGDGRLMVQPIAGLFNREYKRDTSPYRDTW